MLRPIVPCEQQYRYRNKMEFSFAGRAWRGHPAPSLASQQQQQQQQRLAGSGVGIGGGLVLGLRPQGSSTDVLPISQCHLQPEAADAIFALVSSYCREAGLPPWDAASSTGLLQSLAIRSGTCCRSGQREFLVNLVTAFDARRELAGLAALLMSEVRAVW